MSNAIDNLVECLGLSSVKKRLMRDMRDIYYFYVDAQTRQRIGKMGWFRRTVHRFHYLFKSLLRKLSPGRRILLIIALVLQFMQVRINQSGVVIENRGFLLLLLILILELKDKLLAKDELRIGHSVQSALLPASSPDIPGWDIYLISKPANDVGGDLVDLISDRGRRGAVLADVAGKGLGAALLSAKLQSTLRALFPHFAKPAQLCKEVNVILCRDGLPSRFISMFYVEFDSTHGRVHYINAGHFPALFISGRKIQETEKGEPALGLNPATDYRLHQIDCQSGDVLFLYSDGLTEGRNDQNEFWSQERLLKWLAAHPGLNAAETATGLLAEVKAFSGDEPQSDDISLLILRRH
ncbi:MAG TPA: PP2C family protein-serine/threonine phosphatase [bacterium]|nr:PP2C family protein-serine/threonine phosphatase [bacterium]HPG46948.1 PP2C family protein-serine/threonine phosphatase [bacterium]HPM99312.1 PP2C family protein-serine/threonine phosphatase [bacterium]